MSAMFVTGNTAATGYIDFGIYDDTFGGGIYIEKGIVNIYTTTFGENTATRGNDINNYEGTATIHRTCLPGYDGSNLVQGGRIQRQGSVALFAMQGNTLIQSQVHPSTTAKIVRKVNI